MAEVLERPQQPTRHRLDVDAYYKMAEAGILERTARTELIDGVMPAIGSPHAGITHRLNLLFARAAVDGLVLVSVQNPLRLDNFNEPEPDLMLLRPAPMITARATPVPATCSCSSRFPRVH